MAPSNSWRVFHGYEPIRSRQPRPLA
jgi:hypothetical protein